MAIASAGITVAMDALFGNIKPALDAILKIGATDFSADRPSYDVPKGSTIKIPKASVTAASAYNASTNNYLTGGTTAWASLTATHYLQGFDVSGEDFDNGQAGPRIRQLFTRRAGSGIAAAVQDATKTALDAVTASAIVTLPAIGTAVLSDYLNLANGVALVNKLTSVLAVNPATLADIKAKLAATNVVCKDMLEMASFLGFKDMVCIPGMTARAVIIPDGAVGFMGRVPTVIANYRESGVETDPDNGLSVGIVIADDQATNRVVANADLWFGVVTINATESASAVTEAGVIKVA